MASHNSDSPVSECLQSILETYTTARQSAQFGKDHPLWHEFTELQRTLELHPSVEIRSHLNVVWSMGQGNWARVPWVAFLDERETTSTQYGVYIVYLFREDMSGVYLTFNQGVTHLRERHGTREARAILRRRAEQLSTLLADGAATFKTDTGIDLRTESSLGKQYESSTAAYQLYERGRIPPDEMIFQDLEVLLDAYDKYIASDLAREFGEGPVTTKSTADTQSAVRSTAPATDFDRNESMERLIEAIRAKGFIYEPWQVAQYVAAIRTKPFVILAGITGTGKSKLPQLVAALTGGRSQLVPVRPDWTDSAEVLGYTDLQGTFRPGAVLEVAHTAVVENDVHWICVIDEMNLARVEHYFAEVLSRIEDRRPIPSGGYVTSALVQTALEEKDAEWGEVAIPSNFALVGTVNMDESAHGFSRKVLDRAFTIELSDVALNEWEKPAQQLAQSPEAWPVSAWWPRAIRLSELDDLTSQELALMRLVVDQLEELNRLLTPAQLQVGYRTRDEMALFVLHANEISKSFHAMDDVPIDPIDLALQMKILPRIAGGSGGIRRILLGLLGWANSGVSHSQDEEVQVIIDRWEDAGRPNRLPNARYPGMAARVCLMWDRLLSEGFTSYWL